MVNGLIVVTTDDRDVWLKAQETFDRYRGKVNLEQFTNIMISRFGYTPFDVIPLTDKTRIKDYFSAGFSFYWIYNGSLYQI